MAVLELEDDKEAAAPVHRSRKVGGLFIAAFVSIPVLNLATPLFGVAFMVHLHKRLARTTPALLERA